MSRSVLKPCLSDYTKIDKEKSRLSITCERNTQLTLKNLSDPRHLRIDMCHLLGCSYRSRFWLQASQDSIFKITVCRPDGAALADVKPDRRDCTFEDVAYVLNPVCSRYTVDGILNVLQPDADRCKVNQIVLMSAQTLTNNGNIF